MLSFAACGRYIIHIWLDYTAENSGNAAIVNEATSATVTVDHEPTERVSDTVNVSLSAVCRGQGPSI
jgi:hypothetical protein